MKPPRQGFRVGVVGATSLLGKELAAVLKERNFPVERLVTLEDEEGEPALPVVDLREGFDASIADEDLGEEDFDFVFVAARPSPPSRESDAAVDNVPFLRSAEKLVRASRCAVIDVDEGLSGEPGGAVRIPFLGTSASEEETPGFSISAHPATIVIAGLLLRLAARFPLRSAVAQVFRPASEIGPQAVEELQRQAASLLSFQKMPEAVFGQQLAFNLLPRIGRARSKNVAPPGIEGRIHRELREFLGDRAPLPALRFLQAPVFHSLAVSLYVETAKPAPVDSLARALSGERVEVRQASRPAPSQVEASGSDAILVDALVADESHANGVWIWAVADNLRLSVVNAVEIAEVMSKQVRTQKE